MIIGIKFRYLNKKLRLIVNLYHNDKSKIIVHFLCKFASIGYRSKTFRKLIFWNFSTFGGIMMLIYELSVENFFFKFVFLSFVHDQKFYLLHRMNRVVFEVFFDMAAWQRNTFLRRTDLNWNTLIEYRRGKTKKAPASLTTHVHTHPTATKLIAEKVTCLGIQIHVWAAWGRLRLQL